MGTMGKMGFRGHFGQSGHDGHCGTLCTMGLGGWLAYYFVVDGGCVDAVLLEGGGDVGLLVGG